MSFHDGSLESIAFQLRSDYPDRLTALFQKCIDANGDVKVISNLLDDIRQLTHDTTGIWMEPLLAPAGFLEGDYLVSCLVENLNAVSPINPTALSKLEKYDLSNLKVDAVLDGTVDLKNARVTGFFTKIRNHFKMSPSMVDGKFTASEIAALYLHETGHVYVTYEYLGQSLVTNLIVAEILGVWSSDATQARKYEVGRAAVKLSGNPAAIPEEADESTLVALVLQGQAPRMAARAGTRWYDHRLAEALADQFAARWIMGAPLVTAIGKMQRSRGILASRGYDPRWLGLVSNFMTIATLPFGLLSKGVSAAVLAAAKTMTSSLAFSGAMQSILHVLSGGKYDTPRDRIDAIRRETVALLKNTRLDADTRKTLVKDLEIIDAEKASIHSYSDVMARLANWVVQVVIGRKEELAQNNLSEDLANNRLYELAARLKG